MPASPVSSAAQTLILNRSFDVSGDVGPLITSLAGFYPLPVWRRVSGDVGPLQVILVDALGDITTVPRRVILATGNTLHLTAKRNPSDADLALELNFTAAGDAGSEYYVADPGTLSVDTDIFAGDQEMTLLCDFEERNAGGDKLKSWRAPLVLLRSTTDGGSPSPQIYVKTTPQTLTDPQELQARDNIKAVGREDDLYVPGNTDPTFSTDKTTGAVYAYDLTASTFTMGSYNLQLTGHATLSGTNTGDQTRSSLGIGTGDTVTFGGLVSPSVQATTTAGLALKNSAGDTVATVGGTTGTVWDGFLTVDEDLEVTGETRPAALLLKDITEGNVAIGNTGTAKTIALTSGTFQTATLTGNCTFTMPSTVSGKSFTLLLKSGTGGFTATFTGVKWPASSAPTATTAASRLDVFTFVSDGTNWYGSSLLNFTP